MKVLMFGWELPPHVSGGLGIACHGIIQGLLDNQVAVTMILPHQVGPLPHFSANNAALKIIQIPFQNKQVSVYSEQKLFFNPMRDVPFFSIKYAQNILETVQQYASLAGVYAQITPHDVIHAHDWLTILAGIEAKKMSRKPLIFHVHSLEVERCANTINQVIFAIEKSGLEKADAIIAVSQLTKENIHRYYCIPKEKIHVVYNGLFASQICHSAHHDFIPDYKTILFLGRVTAQKAPFHFVEAANKILKYRDDIQFVIAGDGDLLQSVIERVAELRLGRHIHFTRFLNREDVQRMFKRADLYIMPSIIEPFGLTCLEALGQRIPVILSKQSGVAEVIKNILKVDFWDIDDMVAKIAAVLNYPTLSKQLIENATPELYSLLWHKVTKSILIIYEKLLGY